MTPRRRSLVALVAAAVAVGCSACATTLASETPQHYLNQEPAYAGLYRTAPPVAVQSVPPVVYFPTSTASPQHI